LRKIVLALAVLIVTSMILISFSFNIKNVEATNDSNYIMEHVEHTVKVLYDGYVFINDTIQITGNASSFLMGFPYNYGPDIVECVAYSSSEIFPVTLNVPLGNNIGFYGISVSFPQGTPKLFTIGFMFSNRLLTASNAAIFTLNFPAYPSFTESVTANASIIIAGATYINGTVGGFTYGEENLPAFTSMPANITFGISSGSIQSFNINQLDSEIDISQTGAMTGSDNYYITNDMPTAIASVKISLPLNASNPTVQDQFGRSIVGSWVGSFYQVNFSTNLASGTSTLFLVKYSLPNNYSMQTSPNNFTFDFPLFQGLDCYIEQASVTVVLPEGANISNLNNTLIGSVYGLTKNVFHETVVVSRGNVSYLETVLPSEETLQFGYQYNSLWSSFRATLWMWTLAIAGCAIVVAWERPKKAAPAAISATAERLRTEDIKSFVDLYEEKRKVIEESESLETMVQKGRIPRRRYKVRKKTLEIRLGTLSRSLAELTERMNAAGSKYADLMRQLEVAETEINEVEAGIKSITARHGRGEISLETYRKLLTDYRHRKERTESTISGILLRLREEIR